MHSVSSSFRRIGCSILPGRDIPPNEFDPTGAAPAAAHAPLPTLLSHDKVRRRGRIQSIPLPPPPPPKFDASISVRDDRKE